MTSNIKKMYILLIVVLLKTCKRSRGEKSIIWNTSFTGQTYCRECKSPSTLHFSQMWPFKKEVQQAAPRYADSTQLNSTRRKAENWRSLRGESSAWWDVLSLESPFLTSRCLYIFVWRHFMFSEAASMKCFVAVLSTWILLLFMERWSIFSWDIVSSD